MSNFVLCWRRFFPRSAAKLSFLFVTRKPKGSSCLIFRSQCVGAEKGRKRCLTCRRQRSIQSPTDFLVQNSSVHFDESSLEALLLGSTRLGLAKLRLRVTALEDSTLRVVLDEVNPLRARYQPLDALNGEPRQAKFVDSPTGDRLSRLKQRATNATASRLITKDGNEVVLQHDPFRVDFYSAGHLVTSINAKGLLHFEPFQSRGHKAFPDNFWEEPFKGYTDTKPHGGSSFSFDRFRFELGGGGLDLLRLQACLRTAGTCGRVRSSGHGVGDLLSLECPSESETRIVCTTLTSSSTRSATTWPSTALFLMWSLRIPKGLWGPCG